MSSNKKNESPEAAPFAIAVVAAEELAVAEATMDSDEITFAAIAKKIVKKAIRSAVCIDDRFIEPYMTAEEISAIEAGLKPNKNASPAKLDGLIPKGLYRSFRQQGECDLDIYHFKSYEESWKPEYILNNKDLLVIDWELDINDGYESTIKIVREVINSGKIPFIIVYTHKPKDDFIQIAKELISNFNLFNIEQIDATKQAFFEAFLEKIVALGTLEDVTSDDVESFWENNEVIGLLNTFLIGPANRERICEALTDLVCQEFKIENTKSANRKLIALLKDLFKIEAPLCLEYLAYLVTGSNSTERYILNRIMIDQLGFRINNTIITIFSKPGLHNEETSVSPDNVFNHFSTLISSYPHNFITLLSVEMRDRLKEDISKISVGNALIDERAFFQHMDNYHGNKIAFFDFLLKSWVNDLTEYNLNIKPEIFNTIDQYRADNDLVKIDKSQITDSLAYLGCKLSTLTIPERLTKDVKIRFGDIFQIVDLADEKRRGEFLLSITPHCVCTDPGKIENNFYFIKNISSAVVRLATAVNNIEKGYYSFINKEGEILPIEWDCKPFTLYIETNDLNSLDAGYKNKPVRLKYITTLKENFAQRMANNAFEYGTAVGIDLPH
jgi:hypothetical protein